MSLTQQTDGFIFTYNIDYIWNTITRSRYELIRQTTLYQYDFKGFLILSYIEYVHKGTTQGQQRQHWDA